MAEDKFWILYGANGYTGRLIAEAAKKRGFSPVLAGRNKEEITQLGQKLSLPVKIFPCENPELIAKEIFGARLILHCAGPFSTTSKPMAVACLKAKVNYLDITGEITVFEGLLNRSADFAKAGIVAVPGVGFDIVPTDCLSALLHERLPEGNSLELVLKPRGRLSPGTMKTMAEGFFVGTLIREQGQIKMLNKFITDKRRLDGRDHPVVGIPWGDVSAAYFTTGIPNIQVWLVSRPGDIRFLHFLQNTKRIWKLNLMQLFLKTLIEKFVRGPDETELAQSGYEIWGQVKSPNGDQVTMKVQTSNGYSLTVDSALAAVNRLLTNAPAPGAYTPARAFGAGFLKDLSGVTISDHVQI